jgi:hypothetical protein
VAFEKNKFIADCRTCLKAKDRIEAVKQLMNEILADTLAISAALDEVLPELQLNADYAFLKTRWRPL